MMILLAVLGCRNKDLTVDTASIDEGVVDEDGDGFDVDSDCDDNDPAVRPDATEICNGIDDDCDELTDEDVGFDFYADGDSDGFGAGDAVVACEAPEGHVEDATDCDDADDAVNPDADEICNGIDDDCDGDIDTDAVDAETWYADADGDGYGDPATSETTCDARSGWLSDSSDCDDLNAAVHPDADEICNGIDDDCDGAADEDDALDASTWYADVDTDGYGDSGASTEACDQPLGYSDDDTDCDDGDVDVNPGEDELCNGIDDDCDGDIDEDSAIDADTWYADADSDGYGDASSSLASCSSLSGYVDDDTDCDDSDADTNPGADEYCDGHDDDCDGDTDEDDAVDADTWYADSDSDGYGDASSTTTACSEPSAYTDDDTDCDDTDTDVNPGEAEVCNAVDDNCDGDVDEDLMGTGEDCPGESCLEVLEEGTPTDSDYYWIDPDGTGAYEEYCDYGTVGSGWSTKLELTVTNSTGATLSDEMVPVSIDTASLITAGTLEDGGDDLRFFTHDGPLLDYWIETCELDTSATTVWVTFDELSTGDTDFTIAYGNSGTERKSGAWWFDDFETDTSAEYEVHANSSWGAPTWTWDTTSSTVGPGSTNQDNWLMVADLELDGTVYLQMYGWMIDNDAVGVGMSDGSTYTTAVLSDDYDGNQHNGGDESIIEHSGTPTNHYQGSQILDLGNLATASAGHTVGHYWDGSDHFYYLNGTEEGDVSSLASVDDVGLAAFAAQGTPVGAEVEYLWVGPEPIDFDPEDISYSATAATGSESSF